MMTEWRELLQQAHPGFQPPSVSSGGATPQAESSATPTADLEWISPTANLQEKIQNIPDKFGFKIGEAANYVGVKGYVLRYWEAEFDSLKPKKSKNGQRMYTKRDVEAALLIKKLLHEDRFSIEGARTALKKLKKQVRDTGKSLPTKKIVKAHVTYAHARPLPEAESKSSVAEVPVVQASEEPSRKMASTVEATAQVSLPESSQISVPLKTPSVATEPVVELVVERAVQPTSQSVAAQPVSQVAVAPIAHGEDSSAAHQVKAFAPKGLCSQSWIDSAELLLLAIQESRAALGL